MSYSQELYLMAILLLGGAIYAQPIDPPGLGGQTLATGLLQTPPASGITIPQPSVPSALGGIASAVPSVLPSPGRSTPLAAVPSVLPSPGGSAPLAAVPSVLQSPGGITPPAVVSNAIAPTGNGGPILNGIPSPFEQLFEVAAQPDGLLVLAQLAGDKSSDNSANSSALQNGTVPNSILAGGAPSALGNILANVAAGGGQNPSISNPSSAAGLVVPRGPKVGNCPRDIRALPDGRFKLSLSTPAAVPLPLGSAPTLIQILNCETDSHCPVAFKCCPAPPGVWGPKNICLAPEP